MQNLPVIKSFKKLLVWTLLYKIRKITGQIGLKEEKYVETKTSKLNRFALINKIHTSLF